MFSDPFLIVITSYLTVVINISVINSIFLSITAFKYFVRELNDACLTFSLKYLSLAILCDAKYTKY